MALIERVGSAFVSLMASRAAGPDRDDGRPRDVGILAMEFYVPRDMVRHAELETHDGVPAGKYTEGLAQNAMAFLGDREDVVSISMTAVQRLLEKWAVDPRRVGRLEVGTESGLDRSKSVKSFLMALFAASGNTDIQGVDCVNACFGGTAALMNAVNWVESRSWDGRLAVVVAADAAVYAPGPARASGGCGAVAMLVGPYAPLALEPGCCASHMAHAYDFYKPAGPFPQVDGRLSIGCYLTALRMCYQRLVAKLGGAKGSGAGVTLADFDFCVMHAPFCKMVRKGFARMVLDDLLRARQAGRAEAAPSSSQGDAAPLAQLLEERGNAAAAGEPLERQLEAAALQASASGYKRMAAPGTLLGSECGNMYSASLYAGLASLVSSEGAGLAGKRVLAFSYGSGYAACLFGIRGRATGGPFCLAAIAEQLDLRRRLTQRRAVAPEAFTAALAATERLHERAGYVPAGTVADLLPGTYHLEAVDELHRRTYARRPL